MKRSKVVIDWANLHGNLLDVVFSNLVGKDRVNFCLVCPQWNAAVTNRFSPWLVHNDNPNDTWRFYQHNATFIDMNFPDLESREVIVHCSKHGWWLMSWKLDYTLFFFDPNNSQHLELPTCFFEDNDMLDEFMSLKFCFFNPPTSSDCVVVGISEIGPKGEVSVYTLRKRDEWRVDEYQMGRTEIFRKSLRSKTLRMRKGDGEECRVHRYEISNNNKVVFRNSFGAPVLHGGRIYFLSERGDVAVLNLNSEERRIDGYFDCLSRSPKELYLVKVKWEDALFGVFVFGDDKVSVCRLSPEMKWVPVEGGIGDKVLYVSKSASSGFKAPTKALENTVCFPLFFHEEEDSPVFYSLSDSKYRSVDGAFSSDNASELVCFDSVTWTMPMPMPMPEEEITTW